MKDCGWETPRGMLFIGSDGLDLLLDRCLLFGDGIGHLGAGSGGLGGGGRLR